MAPHTVLIIATDTQSNASPGQNADERQKAIKPLSSSYTFTPKAQTSNFRILFSGEFIRPSLSLFYFYFTYNSKKLYIVRLI